MGELRWNISKWLEDAADIKSRGEGDTDKGLLLLKTINLINISVRIG